jgi:hypothetical protein
MDGADKPFLTANEFIAARLGQLIGLPTVPGVIVGGQGDQLGYVSLRFGPRDERPPPILPNEVVSADPSMATGIVVFDCWIANNDRHDENLAMVGSELYLFDHDRALLATGTRDPKMPDHLLGRHCLANELSTADHFWQWTQRIDNVDAHAIGRVILDAVTEGALSETRSADVTEMLRYRRDRLRAMLQEARNDGIFQRMQQWTLLL